MSQDLLYWNPHLTPRHKSDTATSSHKIRRILWFIANDWIWVFQNMIKFIKTFEEQNKGHHPALNLFKVVLTGNLKKAISWQSPTNQFCYHKDDFWEELQLLCPSSKSLLLWLNNSDSRCYRWIAHSKAEPAGNVVTIIHMGASVRSVQWWKRSKNTLNLFWDI